MKLTWKLEDLNELIDCDPKSACFVATAQSSEQLAEAILGINQLPSTLDLQIKLLFEGYLLPETKNYSMVEIYEKIGRNLELLSIDEIGEMSEFDTDCLFRLVKFNVQLSNDSVTANKVYSQHEKRCLILLTKICWEHLKNSTA